MRRAGGKPGINAAHTLRVAFCLLYTHFSDIPTELASKSFKVCIGQWYDAEEGCYIYHNI